MGIKRPYHICGVTSAQVVNGNPKGAVPRNAGRGCASQFDIRNLFGGVLSFFAERRTPNAAGYFSVKLPVLTILFFLIVSTFSGAPAFSAAPAWQSLAPGLSFNRWPVQSAAGEVLDTIIILRLQPDQWAFKVFYHPEPKTLQEWQQTTGAPIVVNGGFFQENFRPAGRILTAGQSIGPMRNRSMKGMFLAEPRKGFEQHPKAQIIDLKMENVEELISQYEQGIQSFPVLVDSRGQVRVNPSSFQANRTVIAQDRAGNILILITEKPFFTLYDLGNYLKKMPLGLHFALNLDGGYRTQLAVHFKTFKYIHAGQGDTGEAARLFFPQGTVKLPSVLAVYPRGGHR